VTLLTIAIPTYKSDSTLVRLLESFKAELHTFSNHEIEILISDNDPESNLMQVLLRTFDSNFLEFVFYSKNESNVGYDGNLEVLVKKANGNYIKFVADDDEIKTGFIGHHIQLIQKKFPDVIISDFDTTKSEIEDKIYRSYLQDKPPITISPPWNHQKLMSVAGRYGQVSSLTFRTSLLLNLKQTVPTNFVHVFWFFSLLEISSIVYDPNPGLIIYLGSPNFSHSTYQIIEIPFQGVTAIHQAKFDSIELKKSILCKEKEYAIQGLRLFPEITWSERAQLLWENRMHLRSLAILKYLPFVFLPKFLKVQIKTIRSTIAS
jgi:glycosyltransferase involved in cell wall biosynthesis